MGDLRPERLPVDCPVCHGDVSGDLLAHLLAAHTREELAAQVVAYVEAEEEDG